MKLVDDSTCALSPSHARNTTDQLLLAAAAIGWRHIPLSNLRTLKLRSTDVNEAALGRILALCALSITGLDISYSNVKSLDIVSQALHSAPAWRLEKLVASGLPLTPATLKGFFGPLAARPEEERSRFHTLKLGSLPAASTKAPGLTDAVLAGILPSLEMLSGLENVSFFQVSILVSVEALAVLIPPLLARTGIWASESSQCRDSWRSSADDAR